MSLKKEQSLPDMEYVRLGKTGLRVSRICLGCMSFGNSAWSPWVKDEQEAIPIIKKAFELGINFFDTSNNYSNGDSERVLGKALKEIGAPRGRYVIATKVYAPVWSDMSKFSNVPGIEKMPEMVNNYGLSRKHIFDSVDASLKRLGVDYIDLYQIHRLDYNTPMEEIMEALNDLVRSGKVRYIGASTMKTWEFQKLNHIAERHGWAQFVSMQNFYNLIYREQEREMAPYCLDSGIGWIPWSPLAAGHLTGKKRTTSRSESNISLKTYMSELASSEATNAIIDRVIEIAEKHKVTAAQVALAWEFTKPYVSSPIVGISGLDQLYDLVGALAVKLSEEDVKYLEEAYVPQKTIIA